MTTTKTRRLARITTTAWLSAWLLVAFSATGTKAGDGPPVAPSRVRGPGLLDAIRPDPARLRSHVERLASAEFAGRRGDGARKTAAYIEDCFREVGLEPLFDGSFTQEIPGLEPEAVLGRNVGAVLVGSDPKLRDEWVVVSAHYDHLGRRGAVYYPGADDNASGVAALLELARSFVEAPTRPARSLMFVGFDLEEDGLVGSRYFAAHPPISLDRIKLFTTADMIARSLGGVCDGRIFVMGAEHAPGLRPLVDEAAEGVPLTIGQIGSDLLVIDRSDYGPFRARDVPYLFFSTGENPAYHTPLDVAETLDYKKLDAAALLIGRTVALAAEADTLPTWVDVPDYSISEARAVLDVLRTLQDHIDDLKVGPFVERWIAVEVRSLDAIVGRGVMTRAERRRMVRGAQFVLFSVL